MHSNKYKHAQFNSVIRKITFFKFWQRKRNLLIEHGRCFARLSTDRYTCVLVYGVGFTIDLYFNDLSGATVTRLPIDILSISSDHGSNMIKWHISNARFYRADNNRLKIVRIFSEITNIVEFHYYIFWNHQKKCIQLSTNMPNHANVVIILRLTFKCLRNETNIMCIMLIEHCERFALWVFEYAESVLHVYHRSLF